MASFKSRQKRDRVPAETRLVAKGESIGFTPCPELGLLFCVGFHNASLPARLPLGWPMAGTTSPRLVFLQGHSDVVFLIIMWQDGWQ